MPKIATFRFYEELNDFLPIKKRKVAFEHSFTGKPTVKDLIEALGVPHAEVDLILVNGDSVTFSYILKDKDFVSVYPVFESVDISVITRLREKPLREPAFILDVHLGRLARYLRMLGFDASYRNDYDDNEIIAASLKEHRIILTRDIGLLKVGAVTHGYYVRTQIPKEQVKEVIKRFDLVYSIRPFNRCINCNQALEKVTRDEVTDQLQPLTILYFNKFFRCTGCGKVFWEGSHFERMKTFIADLIKPN
ncbi:MAG TPA: Mut7-C RNAse domain-containing protein [Lentimicrobium sp.]|nr:Mut7-C RNAse domain-containing protein [Lentimicrobium sp.]